MTSVLGEILEWSKDRPLWQRDALRRLVTGTELTDAVIDELKELCKLPHGLAKNIEPVHLTAEHVALEKTRGSAVELYRVTHHSGVNALAPEQTVSFGPNLTVVFGRNAAGKSGYTRILKRACRSRHLEDVLGNVLSGEAPVAANATIAFRRGDETKSFAWTQNAAPDDDLAAVSVFDAQSAAVYLKDKTDVAFRPFGLDIFDRLSTICGQVRARLEHEQQQLDNAPALPSIPEGTRVKALLDGLTALTNVDEVRGLGTLSDVEQQRLALLRAHLKDFQANNPKARGQELKLKAGRLNALLQHVEHLGGRVSCAAFANFKAANANLAAARRTLETARSAAFPKALLKGTGGEEWFRLWGAAEAFSSIAYPVSPFPVTVDARCVLCQQPVGEDAGKRFEHFANFARSNAQIAVQTAQGEKETTRRILIEPTPKLPETELAVDELKVEAPELAAALESYLHKVAVVQQDVEKFAEREEHLAFPEAPIDALRTVIVDVQERSAALLREDAALDEKEQRELKELEARAILAGSQQVIINEIERKKRIAAYRQCLDDTTTNAVTRKSTDLTKALVTDQLQQTFKKEIAQIEFTDLAVAIQPAGGTRGALYHKIVFSNAPGVSVASVLSEGESRALSLAAFMTELSTSDVRSSIVFDDPVSSLDHIWRDRIARRLAVEAKTRQVIVFTHDLVFLRALMDHADNHDVAYQHQYVRREGGPGISSSDLPWFALPIKERLGVLRNEWQAADKEFRTGLNDAYDRAARQIYGRLREAWEQAVGEVLLNDVIDRFRPSVQTQRARVLFDISKGDCKKVDDAMTECSRWIIGHDRAAAEDTPVPEPTELKSQIDILDAWVKSIRKRRS